MHIFGKDGWFRESQMLLTERITNSISLSFFSIPSPTPEYGKASPTGSAFNAAAATAVAVYYFATANLDSLPPPGFLCCAYDMPITIIIITIHNSCYPPSSSLSLYISHHRRPLNLRLLPSKKVSRQSCARQE